MALPSKQTLLSTIVCLETVGPLIKDFWIRIQQHGNYITRPLVFLIEYAHRISHSGTNVTTEMTFIVHVLNTYL